MHHKYIPVYQQIKMDTAHGPKFFFHNGSTDETTRDLKIKSSGQLAGAECHVKLLLEYCLHQEDPYSRGPSLILLLQVWDVARIGSHMPLPCWDSTGCSGPEMAQWKLVKPRYFINLVWRPASTPPKSWTVASTVPILAVMNMMANSMSRVTSSRTSRMI